MKRALLTSVAILILIGAPQARPFGFNDLDQRPRTDVQQFGPDDDYDEVLRPGPRGDEGEAIDLAPPGPGGDDEVIEPGPPSDGDIDD